MSFIVHIFAQKIQLHEAKHESQYSTISLTAPVFYLNLKQGNSFMPIRSRRMPNINHRIRTKYVFEVCGFLLNNEWHFLIAVCDEDELLTCLT